LGLELEGSEIDKLLFCGLNLLAQDRPLGLLVNLVDTRGVQSGVEVVEGVVFEAELNKVLFTYRLFHEGLGGVKPTKIVVEKNIQLIIVRKYLLINY